MVEQKEINDTINSIIKIIFIVTFIVGIMVGFSIAQLVGAWYVSPLQTNTTQAQPGTRNRKIQKEAGKENE